METINPQYICFDRGELFLFANFTYVCHIIGLLHEYWGILSRVEFYIARASECNIYSTRDNIPQYSCHNPFIV